MNDPIEYIVAMIPAMEKGIKQHGAASIQLIKDNLTPTDSFIKISFTEKEEHLKTYRADDDKSLSKVFGYSPCGIDVVLSAVAEVVNPIAAEQVRCMMEHGLIRTDDVYFHESGKKWLFVSEYRVVFIHLVNDPEAVAKQMGYPVSTTVH